MALVRRHGGAVYLTFVMLALAAASYWLSANAAHRATAATASTLQLCQLGNEARAQQIHLWDFIIHLSKGPPHETAAERAQRARNLAAFEAYLHHVFAPRHCGAITGSSP